MWKTYLGGFPGCLGIKKEPPAKTEDTEVGPWPGMIPWAIEQLSPHALEIMVHNKRSHSNEKPSTQVESSPCSLQLGKARLQQ